MKGGDGEGRGVEGGKRCGWGGKVWMGREEDGDGEGRGVDGEGRGVDGERRGVDGEGRSVDGESSQGGGGGGGMEGEDEALRRCEGRGEEMGKVEDEG